jgi:2-oxoglutarate ferredoxin oxidoreductase subunit delta
MTSGEPKSSSVLTRGTVVIDVERCKGCELCIEACKPAVLSMTVHERNSMGFQYPVLSPGCTACRACAQVCPDYVFQVWRYDNPVAIAGGPEEAQ